MLQKDITLFDVFNQSSQYTNTNQNNPHKHYIIIPNENFFEETQPWIVLNPLVDNPITISFISTQ